MGNPAHPERRAELEASAPWLDDEHFTLLDDDGPTKEREEERPKRYDHTQRIWCPRGAA